MTSRSDCRCGDGSCAACRVGAKGPQCPEHRECALAAGHDGACWTRGRALAELGVWFAREVVTETRASLRDLLRGAS